jgi:diacylglycerol O-acyltransferase-1
LCIILLVLSNARVALENILKYGILVDPFAFARVITDPTFVPCIQLFIGLWVMAFVSLMIEKILSTGILSETLAKILITGHTGAVVFVPAYVVYVGNCQLTGAVAVLSFASVTFLKLISYHMVNYWCRMAPRGSSKSKKNYSAKLNNNNTAPETSSCKQTEGEDSKPLVRYPDNLNVRDLIYFMLVPTLCYELNFPRTRHIRKRFVTRRAIEAIFLSQLMIGLVQQWLFPTIINSTAPLKEMNYLKMFERLLKLAVC